MIYICLGHPSLHTHLHALSQLIASAHSNRCFEGKKRKEEGNVLCSRKEVLAESCSVCFSSACALAWPAVRGNCFSFYPRRTYLLWRRHIYILDSIKKSRETSKGSVITRWNKRTLAYVQDSILSVMEVISSSRLWTYWGRDLFQTTDHPGVWPLVLAQQILCGR